MRKINLFNLNYNLKEQEAVIEVLKSKWITMGAKTEEFEKKFSRYIGSQYGVALNSCTAALHLALKVLGIGPGDEVILPSLTFVATANSVLYTGATPVFADVCDLNNWTVSPEDIGRKINNRTRAIMVMHYAGFGCDMDSIRGLADKNNLKIVEDACHAPGGMWKGKRLGTLGDFSCYSFYSNKNMATAEGGMLLTNEEENMKRVKLLRSHGMTTSAHERDKGAEFYDVIELGYNYRLDDIRSSLGLVQLEKLPDDIKTRNIAADRYAERLSTIDSVAVPFQDYDGLSTYYIFPVLLKEGQRTKVGSELGKLGVRTSMHYPPIHLFRHVMDYSAKLPVTEAIGRRALSLPIYAGMPLDDVDYVCDSLEKVLQ